MAYTGSAQGSGRASSGAIGPVRPVSADRKASDALTPDESAAREKESKRAAEAGSKTDTARRRAASPNANDARPPATPPEERAENIKALKKLESEALYSGPPTIRERAVAQLAHAFLIREEAALRAQHLEEIRLTNERQEAARFLAQRAAAAYRQLDEYAGASPGALIS